jgi:hypothetical protein
MHLVSCQLKYGASSLRAACSEAIHFFFLVCFGCFVPRSSRNDDTHLLSLLVLFENLFSWPVRNDDIIFVLNVKILQKYKMIFIRN